MNQWLLKFLHSRLILSSLLWWVELHRYILLRHKLTNQRKHTQQTCRKTVKAQKRTSLEKAMSTSRRKEEMPRRKRQQLPMLWRKENSTISGIQPFPWWACFSKNIVKGKNGKLNNTSYRFYMSRKNKECIERRTRKNRTTFHAKNL